MDSQTGSWRERATTALCVLLALVTLPAGQLSAASSSPGLRVNSRGVLTRNGSPYRGIGVNYYDAFIRTLRNRQDVSYREGFSKLGEHQIPFARFASGGYTAQDFQLYLTDKAAYFRLLDGVVQSAEKSNVGLIASLFWSISAVSDLVHEPREAWGDPQSKTRQFMRNYTKEVVARYSDSPAIWGWEFSCELSLAVDLPNPPRNSGKIAARAISITNFQSASLDFARVVRGIDSNRILLTGNSLPRASAYHNMTEGSFASDTEQQFATILLRDNPAPFNPICIHASPAAIDRYFGDRRVSYGQLLQTCINIGRSAGKPIYVEEFVPVPARAGLFGGGGKDYFVQELNAIETSGVPMASIWVYDRKLLPDRSNVTFDNERSYMLDMIAAANRRLH